MIKTILIKRTLGIEYGSEGPYWDPYGYTEYCLYEEKEHYGLLVSEKVVLHLGLDSWIKKNGQLLVEEDCEQLWEKMTKLSLKNFEDYEHRAHSEPRVCPVCGSKKKEYSSGYPGETFVYCDSGHYVYMYYSEARMRAEVE
jgi:hypothetical protein